MKIIRSSGVKERPTLEEIEVGEVFELVDTYGEKPHPYMKVERLKRAGGAYMSNNVYTCWAVDISCGEVRKLRGSKEVRLLDAELTLSA